MNIHEKIDLGSIYNEEFIFEVRLTLLVLPCYSLKWSKKGPKHTFSKIAITSARQGENASTNYHFTVF